MRLHVRRLLAAGALCVLLITPGSSLRRPAAAAPGGDPGAGPGPEATVTTALTEVAPREGPLAAEEARAGIGLNLESVGLPLPGLTGRGVTVAVIDSGIDPGHPDLQEALGGGAKLVDWKDFTDEGFVALTEEVAWGETYTAPDGRTFVLPGRPAASRAARFGYWSEARVPGRIGRDLDRNGLPLDKFGVLAVDSQQTGVYDLVYVDTNNDGSFADETPLRPFTMRGDVARLGRFRTGDAAQRQLAFVLAELDPAGRWASFGFDSLGHGTQVAGVLAASGSGLTGVAPGARLMALKVVTSLNTGTWSAVERAVRYAAEHGADVINISLGGLPARPDSAAGAVLSEIAAEYDVLIVLAADNTGPGLSSGPTVGSPWEALVVGGYFSPAMWERDYGYAVPAEGVWWRSGMGPRADGAYLPGLIAPAGSPTTSPRWLDSTGYTTVVGTSIAAPHAAGAAALLLEAARREGLSTDHRALRAALEQGARALEGYGFHEQGYGLLNVPEALARLRALTRVPALAGRGGAGLLAREYRPGGAAVYLTNQSASVERYAVRPSAGWVRSPFASLTLPPAVERRLDLTLDPPSEPGVHAAWVELVPEGGGAAVRLPVTYVRPVELEGGGYAADYALPVARYERVFVEVAEGAGHLFLHAESRPGADGLAQGRFQVQVFTPSGDLLFDSGVIGQGGAGISTEFYVQAPMAGTWEVVVTALPGPAGTASVARLNLALQVSNPPFATPQRVSVRPGQTVTVEVPVFNPGYGISAQAKAVGLQKAYQPHYLDIKTDLNLVDAFELPSPAGSLLLEITGFRDGGERATIWVYRFETVRGWVPYWWGGDRTPNGERIELFNVPAGRYQVYIVYDGQKPADFRYHYRRSVALDGGHLAAPEEIRWREPRSTWRVPVTITAPAEPGLYHGHVLVIDTNTGQSVAWIPLEVSVGEPALSIQPLVSNLAIGRPGTVTLEVRDAETGDRVDGAITVNGERYETRQGQVTVPVTPWEAVLEMRVQARLPGYRPFDETVRIAVPRSQSGPPDVDGDDDQVEAWRQRLQNLLQ